MSYTLIQVAKIPGQYDVQIGFTVDEYVVTYGAQVTRFQRSVTGFQGAVKEFEECVAHAWTCATPSDEEMEQEEPATRQWEVTVEGYDKPTIYTLDLATGRMGASWEGMDREGYSGSMDTLINLRDIAELTAKGLCKEIK